MTGQEATAAGGTQFDDSRSDPGRGGGGSAAGGAGSDAPKRTGRQAIILVHGMGEPVPLGTLRGFIQTMWQQNPRLTAWFKTKDSAKAAATEPSETPAPPASGATAPGAPAAAPARPTNPVWYRPDFRTGSREMARFVTRKPQDDTGAEGLRTDFFELYWADLTATNTWEHFKDWFRVLLLRAPSQVPKPVFGLWLLLWGFTVLFIVAAAVSTGLVDRALLALGFCRLPVCLWFLALVINGLFLLFLRGALISFFGDVARYVRAAPANIAVRDATRARGLELLRSLHQSDEHERIVLVGHSLGSIVAYDLVRLYWEEFRLGRNLAHEAAKPGARVAAPGDKPDASEAKSPKFQALRDTQDAAANLDAAVKAAAQSAPEATTVTTARTAFRAAQRALQRELAVVPPDEGQGAGSKRPPPTRWLISDLVTVGSPLTHAEFLLAEDLAALRQQQEERQFPCCPPVGTDEENRFSYKAREGVWLFDQGAVFAAVRWTNLYDPARWLLCGDPISGPLAGIWGPGIHEETVAPPGFVGSVFTHTGYWDVPKRPNEASLRHLDVLRAALHLVD